MLCITCFKNISLQAETPQNDKKQHRMRINLTDMHVGPARQDIFLATLKRYGAKKLAKTMCWNMYTSFGKTKYSPWKDYTSYLWVMTSQDSSSQMCPRKDQISDSWILRVIPQKIFIYKVLWLFIVIDKLCNTYSGSTSTWSCFSVTVRNTWLFRFGLGTITEKNSIS